MSRSSHREACLSVALLSCGVLIQTAAFAADAGSDVIANTEAAEVSLREAQDRWLKVLDGHDVNAIMSFLAEDAMLLPMDGELISDRKALRAHYQKGIEQRNAKLKLHIANIEAVVEGDLGYTLGTYTITDANGEIAHRGKYIELWRWEKGAWKLSRDISNSSLPAPSDTRESSPTEASSER